MKIKQAHTLTEILIALTIIAVITAVMLPLVNKFRPDNDKAMYLKTYDSLVYSIKSLQDNEIVYPNTMTTEDGTEYDVSRCLFINTENDIQEGPFVGINGVNKLGQILGKVFNSTGEPVINEGNNTVSFKVNADDWVVNGYRGDPLVTGEFFNTVTVNHNNHDYEFCITANGNVIPLDVQGQAFIRTRSFWRKGNVNIEGLQAIDTNSDNIHDIKLNLDNIREDDGRDETPTGGDDTPTGGDDTPTGGDETPTGGDDTPTGGDDDTRSSRANVKGYPCTESYIALDPGYNVYDKNGNVRDVYMCQNGMAYMELEDHQGTAKEAYQKCEELGGRLPTTEELSAAIKYHDLLGLKKKEDRILNNYISLGTINDLKYYSQTGNLPKGVSNCSLGSYYSKEYKGDCGVYMYNRVERFRCVFDD